MYISESELPLNFMLEVGVSIYAILISLSAVVRVMAGKSVSELVINPNRKLMWAMGIGFLIISCKFLFADVGFSLTGVFNELLDLFRERKASYTFTFGLSLAVLGLSALILVGKCHLMYPRDPRNFTRPRQRKSALKHYVRLRGGLDGAILLKVTGDWDILEKIEVICRKQLRRHLKELSWRSDERETVNKEFEAMKTCHQKMKAIDELIVTLADGKILGLSLDILHGARRLSYLTHRDNPEIWILYGFTLHEKEYASGSFDEHFRLLERALKSIEEGSTRL